MQKIVQTRQEDIAREIEVFKTREFRDVRAPTFKFETTSKILKVVGVLVTLTWLLIKFI